MKTGRKKARGKPIAVPAVPDAGDRFRKDLVTREEAAELTPDGKLPLKATHAIIKKPDGSTELKRARYKLF